MLLIKCFKALSSTFVVFNGKFSLVTLSTILSETNPFFLLESMWMVSIILENFNTFFFQDDCPTFKKIMLPHGL